MPSTTSRSDSGQASAPLATIGELFEVILGGESKIAIEINPTVNALDAFEIYAKAHPQGTYSRIAGVSADFTTPRGFVAASSVDLTTLAAGQFGCCILQHLETLHSISVRASGAVGASTVNWKYTAGD